MRKKLLISGVVLVMMVLVSWSMAFAGAWTRDKGKFYHQVTVNYYQADHYFDDEGDEKPVADNGEFKDTHVSYYMEYGLLNRLTFATSFAYKSLKFENDAMESETKGFSDIDLMLRYKLLDTSIGIVSVQGLIKVPEAYDEDETVPLGNGQYDAECRILYGKSLYPYVPGYVNLEAGYRYREDIPSDEWRYLVEFGLNFTPKIYSRVKLDGILSVGNSDDPGDSSLNPSVTPESDLGKLDLALGYKISTSLFVELGMRPEIYGQNTSKGLNTSIAVAFMH